MTQTSNNTSSNEKKKVLLHIHMYRIEQLKKIAKYVKEILKSQITETEVVVTITNNSDTFKQKIAKLIPTAKIILVENKGYDLGPFFYVLKKFDMDKYDFIAKMHTKDDRFFTYTETNCSQRKNYFTRRQSIKLLFDAIYKSTQIWDNNINHFLTTPKLGMIGSSYFIVPENKDSDTERELVSKYFEFAHISPEKYKAFIAGTIFIARSKALSNLKQYNLLDTIFQETSGAKQSTLAHVFEHLLGFMVYEQGFEIQGFDQTKWKDLTTRKTWQHLKKFICCRVTTISNKKLIKVFKIPVYNKKIKNCNYNDVIKNN